MKSKNTILFLWAIVQLSFSQSFYWQNPLPQANTLLQMHFFDALNGVAIGAGSTYLKTTDGGKLWNSSKIQAASSVGDFRSLFFLDAKNGWIVGSTVSGFLTPIVLNTTDGGETWTSKNNGAPAKLWGVYFRNTATGWIVGEDGKIFKTTNGGTNWNAQTSGTTNALYRVYFFDDSTGYVFGDLGQVRKTTNGGTTWNFVTNPMSKILGVQFLDKDTGYIVGTSAKIAKTTDGGATWNTQTISSSNDVTAIYFIDFVNGWAARNDGRIFKTTNNGASWSSLGYINGGSSSTFQINSLKFFDVNNGIAAGNAGTMYTTTNGGANWTPIGGGIRTDFDGVYFLNKNTGFVVGSTNAGSYIGKTTTGGKTWNFQSTTSGKPRVITFVNQNYGWYAGDNGVVYKTTNGGSTWSVQSANFSLKIYSLSFSDTTNGWMCGDNAAAVKTTNGGTDWISQTFTASSVVMLSSAAVVRATNSIVYRSTNNGVTWDSTNGRGTKFSFIDSTNGWILNGSKIMITTDGGKNWTEKLLPTTFAIPNAIAFVSKMRGWIVGTNGLVLATTDGGNSWEQKYVGTGTDIKSLHAVDTANVWLVGTAGTILGPTNGSITAVNTLNEKVMPAAFLLSQNYPNPFNPTTTIRFTVPENLTGFKNLLGLHVTLKVYDVLGKEVTTLVNENLSSGNYSVEFDASKLGSGVYFYKLQSGNYVETKRMLLLK